MSLFNKLIKISRPRFWFYILGPAILGLTSTNNLRLESFFMLFIFAIPANIFIYGINDYHDFDTDHFNEKKGKQEHKLLLSEKKWLKNIILLSLFCLFIPLFLNFSHLQKFIYSIFIFLSWAYSSPPFRFKARPFFDSISNLFYILPAFFFNQDISPIFFCWPIAMHLYSAIPDIKPDRQAGLQTTATYLNLRPSLLLCFILWSVFAIFLLRNSLIFFPALIYPLLTLVVFWKNSSEFSKKVYWYFPTINTFMGFLGFIYLVFTSN